LKVSLFVSLSPSLERLIHGFTGVRELFTKEAGEPSPASS